MTSLHTSAPPTAVLPQRAAEPGEAGQSRSSRQRALDAARSAEGAAESVLSARPIITLAVAAGLGAAIGWWIKRS